MIRLDGELLNLLSSMSYFFRASVKSIRRLFGGDSWSWSAPYDYVSEITVDRIHEYLGLERKDIRRWCIVGGYLGHEIPKLLRDYPELHVDIFEPSHRYASRLFSRFQNSPRVTVVQKAVSDRIGTVSFFETTLPGSGSVFQVGDFGRESYGLEQAESFKVETITLDSYYRDFPDSIAVLQVDVQGAEELVLKGGIQTLVKTKAIFIEVSENPDLYLGGVSHREIHNILESQGFSPALVGLDINRTGNALYLRSTENADNL